MREPRPVTGAWMPTRFPVRERSVDRSLRVRLLASVADDAWSTRADSALSLCMWVCIGPCEKLVVASSCAWQIGNTGSDDGQKEAYKMLRPGAEYSCRSCQGDGWHRREAVGKFVLTLLRMGVGQIWQTHASTRGLFLLFFCSPWGSITRQDRQADSHLVFFFYVIRFVTKL